MDLEKLTEKTDRSKYTLVIVAAKRARNITDGEQPRVSIKSTKPVVIALHELESNKISWERYQTSRY